MQSIDIHPSPIVGCEWTEWPMVRGGFLTTSISMAAPRGLPRHVIFEQVTEPGTDEQTISQPPGAQKHMGGFHVRYGVVLDEWDGPLSSLSFFFLALSTVQRVPQSFGGKPPTVVI